MKGNEKDCICDEPDGKHRKHCDAYRLSEFLKQAAPIVVKEGETYKVRKPMDVGPLYQLVRYAQEKGQRFGQALVNTLGVHDPVLFYMENEELEKRIKEFIKQ